MSRYKVNTVILFVFFYRTMLQVYWDHIPAGVSARAMVHFAQLHLNNNEFAKLDFGSPEQNLEHYGSEVPPLYDLSQVSAPTAIFVGEKDDFATLPDVDKLVSVLPNVIHYELLDFPGCTHYEFAIGIDAGKIIYKPKNT